MPKPPDVYASHLPVLAALSWVLPMRRVLEFGAGLHSTPFFLGLAECRQLVTVEVDREWRDRIVENFSDERLSVRESCPPTLGCFDLVFIDDGEAPAHREQTIRWVLSRPHPPVVIHDSNVAEYRRAIDQLADDHFTFNTDPPTELVR